MSTPRASDTHKAAYGIDYDKKAVDYGPFKFGILSDNAEMELTAVIERLEEDKEIMAAIAEKMREIVDSHIAAASGPPLLEDTLEKKRKAGWNLAPLQATGTLRKGIVARSRKHFASARREKGTSSGPERSLTFAFLHDLGIGRMEARPFMHLTTSEMESIFGVYEAFADEVLAE